MNQYESQREPIGTPAVHTSLTEDLYLSIHNIDPDSGTVGLLVLVKPMVGWIWIATAVMALGGLVALLPAGPGATVAVRATAPATPAAAEGSR
jgi:cytochrome c biogenesis factor